MKKLIAIVLAALTVLSFSTVVFAADTTTLTTTVPDATYTLNIPADQEIPFGATSTDIGNVTVTDSSSFAVGKNLQVTMTYDVFKADGISTTIPYYINFYAKGINGESYERITSGNSVTFYGASDGTVGQKAKFTTMSNYQNIDVYGEMLKVRVDSTDWGKALAGEYSSTITFTAEVVSES